MAEIENTDVIETQVPENTDNTQNQDREVASLLASVGIREDGTRFEKTNTEQEQETTEIVKEEKPEKETIDERRERRQTQKLARRLKKQQEEFEKNKTEYEKKIAVAKEDPIAYLQELGITLSDWAEKTLDTKENKALKEIERLRQEMQQKEQKTAEDRIRQESEYYHKQLTDVVLNEFKTNANKFTHINALVSEGLFNNEFFEAMAAKVQNYFDETGEKLDLDEMFMEEEKELEKLTNALLKIHQRPVVGRVGNNPKTTTPVATLSNRVNQVTNPGKEPETPDEIKAKVMEKYGIGKAYNP